MKTKIKAVRAVRTKSYLKQKLVSATALLLLSAIMLVSSSYAWYVLSTAPEVSNIKTQVGANGALEITLLDERSWVDLNRLDMGDIDESVSSGNPIASTIANLTWGNLVNLDDASYGLGEIVLQPSRLYIEKSGSDVSNQYTVNSNLLKTPIYGEDGRVKGLDPDSTVAWSYRNGSFSNADGYGVRAIGTSATMSVFQLGMNAARSALQTYSTAAKSSASNSLQDTGGDLANLVVAFAVSDKQDGFTDADVEKIMELAGGLGDSLDAIDVALRYVFAGYITTAEAYYVERDGETDTEVLITPQNYQSKLAEITSTTMSLESLLETYPGITDVVDGIVADIEKFYGDRAKVDNAVAACESLLNTDNDHSWEELSQIIYPLVDTTEMQVNGKTIDELKSTLIKVVPKDPENPEAGTTTEIDFVAALALLQSGLTITVPSGSGILSDIADFAGNYSADVEVSVDGSMAGLGDQKIPVDVLMSAVGVNPSHLGAANDALKAGSVADAAGSNSITDYYGYAIDLAFRTNASDSNLLLQTEAQNRIYEDDNRNAALQGSGSYMSFTTTAGLSATKMVKLMSGLRVVLMDGSQNILGIAALDCTLGKDVYTLLEDGERTDAKYAYLDGSAGAYQNSDLIDKATYEALPETSAVQFNKTTGKVTAKLYLYEFEMTRSETSTEEETKYTGGITLTEKNEEGVITALDADVVQKVTVLVYLDGSVVNNSTVAANSMHSMTGNLNLQFSSSAELMPATNTQLQTDGNKVEYTLLNTELYNNGYLYYANTLCKVKDGYNIYVGSDEKLYFATAESEYTEMTASSAATALELITVALTPATATVAVGENVELTLALSDESLTVVNTNANAVGGDYAEVTTNGSTVTLTGVSAGEIVCTGEVTVKIGAESYTIHSNSVTVTVTSSEQTQE